MNKTLGAKLTVVDDPLHPGPIWHERRRDDGSIERIPGWVSHRDGMIHLDVLTPDEARWAGFPEENLK